MYKLTLKLSSKLQANWNWGSVFHGILMSVMDPEWANALHEEGQRMFSQYIESVGEDMFLWHIGTLTDATGEMLAESISNSSGIHSNRMNVDFSVLSAECRHQDIIDLLDECRKTNPPKGLRIDLKTPSGHKSKGRYINFPDMAMILRGLANKVTQVIPDFVCSDEIRNNLRDLVCKDIQQLACFLLKIAEWSGIGIKTALGMGGCKVIELNRK